MNKDIQNLLISEYLLLHRVEYAKRRWNPSDPDLTNVVIGISKNEHKCVYFCDETSGSQCDLDYIHPKNYAGSLDAMHNVEKYLLNKEGDDWGIYCDNLMDIIVSAAGYSAAELYCHASAATRAEAFLKTIGKWKE